MNRYRHAPTHQRVKLPPYTHSLDRDRWREKSLWVLTGKGAWDHAKSPHWFPGFKIVLPFGDDIGEYQWPAGGRECIVASFGEQESHERLHKLSVALIQAGARSVIWCVEGGPIPAPLYKPRDRAT